MHLKSLTVQGFKSFPDKTVIHFGQDITAIVGPNGSGKSNISDAIAWVMGEQSTKSLRGSKMEDVIFGGTQKRSAVGFAEATLTLDNSDRALPYDADEVMVTRRYYRSGDSEYYINRQSARLKDINEMFMDTGLGREGYSNIGQGRIDEILSLKSADRREIFEEAAGISKYRHRKEETQRRLEATEGNLLRIGDKISELELQLDPLRQQSEKAKRYLEWKEELQGLEVAVWLDSLDRLSAAAKKAEEDYRSADFVLQQAHEDLDKLYAQSEEYGRLLRQRDGELETARAKSNLLEGAGQQLAGQMAVLQSNAENHRANIARIQEELQGTEDRSGGLGNQLAQTYRRIQEICDTLEEKNRALEDLERELTAMTENAQGLTRQFLELRSQETALTAGQAAREADVGTLEDSLREGQQRIAQLQEDLEAGKAREDQARKALEESTRALDQARQQVQEETNRIAGFTLLQKNREAQREDQAGKLREITNRLDGVRARARVYRAMEQGFENYQKSVRAVMQEAQRGGLGHIHGPVSRLIRTEDDYTVAIEIALGAAAQYIVVDSQQDGKAAISYLKRTGAGRATFLPLSVIQGSELREAGLEECPGFVGIASRLVRCQEQYRPIVENLLGRTGIVRNLDGAIAIANRYHHRFRLVTLDGQVVNTSGSMTGGSVNREAGILSRANELERLTEQEKALAEEQAAAQKALGEAQRALDQAEYQLTTARDTLRQAEDRVLRQQGLQGQGRILLDGLLEAKAGAARELETLSSRAKSDRERLESQKAQQAACREQLEKTRLALQDLEGSQAEAAEASSKLTQGMTALKTQQAALEAERETAEAHAREMEALRASMEGDREKKQAMIQGLQEEIRRLEEEMEALRLRREENQQEAAQTRETVAALLARRSEAEAARTRSEREIQEKNKDILNMERACALLENKKSTTAMEERQIIDKLWDTYGLTPGTAAEKRAPMDSVTGGNRRIGELKRKIAALGTPNLGAIEEYARVSERYDYLTAQRDDVLTSKRELESIIRNITQEMTGIFLTEFQKIDRYFGQTFGEMFGGGKGQLLLEDPQDPLGCGIEIRVQPPGKQVKTITLLSGGEKAFVAIALYFAILKVRPTPFCMLDEIDAALDDRNVERFAAYLRGLADKTQFIVITHRRGTMEASDVLYGVTMQEQGVSKLLRLDLNQMEQQLGIMES